MKTEESVKSASFQRVKKLADDHAIGLNWQR